MFVLESMSFVCFKNFTRMFGFMSAAACLAALCSVSLRRQMQISIESPLEKFYLFLQIIVATE